MFGRNLYLDIIFFLESFFGKPILAYYWPSYHNIYFNRLRNFAILYTLLLPTVWSVSPSPAITITYSIWTFAHIIVVTDAYSLWPTRDKKKFIENVHIQRNNLKHDDPKIRKAILIVIRYRRFDKRFRNIFAYLQFCAFLLSASVIIFGADLTINTIISAILYEIGF